MKSKLFIDGTPVDDVLQFPGGEMHLRLDRSLLVNRHSPVIRAHICDAEGVMSLALLIDALRDFTPAALPTLELLYFPYARQDRVALPGEPLSVRAFARLINALGFRKVRVLDPHRDMVKRWVDVLSIIPQETLEWEWPDNPVIVIPDKGAEARCKEAGQTLRFPNYIQMHKVRDPKDGKLSGFEVVSADIAPAASSMTDFIIIDDICYGGGTFLGVADALKNKGFCPRSFTLRVTHGIFSAGGSRFNGVFDVIQTTESWDPDRTSLEGYTGKFQQIKVK